MIPATKTLSLVASVLVLLLLVTPCFAQNSFQAQGITTGGLPGYQNTWMGAAAITSNTTLTASSATLETIDSTGGAVTVTLPAASTNKGKPLSFIAIAGTAAITLTAAGSDTINGAASIPLGLGQFISIESDSTTAWRTVSRSFSIGGDGSDGALSKSGTETNIIQWNATTFTISSTYTVKSGSNINCTGAFTTGANTLTVSPGMRGGDGAQASSSFVNNQGAGIAGGQGNNASGGAGGACGGNGGGGSTTSFGQGNGGLAVPLFVGLQGSGGGGTDLEVGTATVGAGGGSLRICNSGGGITISTSGAINAVGGATASNATASFHGAGAGSGGVLSFYSTVSVTYTGSASVAGGAAGALTGTGTLQPGGGGGGGYVVRMSPSNTGAGTITVSGGAAGTGRAGSQQPGNSGVSLSITGTPNHPLLTEHKQEIKEMIASGWMEDGHRGRGHLAPMFAIPSSVAFIKGNDPFHVEQQQHEHVTMLAALRAKDGHEFESLCYDFNFGEGMDESGKTCVLLFIGDDVELNAA